MKSSAALLVDQGIVSGQTLVHSLAKCLGVRGCHLRHGLIDPTLISEIGEDECEKSVVIPMFKVGNTLTVAMAEPQSLRRSTDCVARPVAISDRSLLESNILEYVRKYRAVTSTSTSS